MFESCSAIFIFITSIISLVMLHGPVTLLEFRPFIVSNIYMGSVGIIIEKLCSLSLFKNFIKSVPVFCLKFLFHGGKEFIKFVSNFLRIRD